MKKKRNRSKQQTQKAHMVRFPGVGLVTFPPSRESKTPFCAYYGPNGETCSIITGLEIVGTLPSRPLVVYMACPLHFDDVHQAMQRFLTNLEKFSKYVQQSGTFN